MTISSILVVALRNLFFIPTAGDDPDDAVWVRAARAAFGAHWICHCWLRLVVLQVWITTEGKLVKFFLGSRHLPLGGLRIWPETL